MSPQTTLSIIPSIEILASKLPQQEEEKPFGFISTIDDSNSPAAREDSSMPEETTIVSKKKTEKRFAA